MIQKDSIFLYKECLPILNLLVCNQALLMATDQLLLTNWPFLGKVGGCLFMSNVIHCKMLTYDKCS